jgi:polyisoprenoid-binding protein YceI
VGPTKRIGFVATTAINRHDFGVSWNAPLGATRMLFVMHSRSSLNGIRGQVLQNHM